MVCKICREYHDTKKHNVNCAVCENIRVFPTLDEKDSFVLSVGRYVCGNDGRHADIRRGFGLGKRA